jgi:preprotein translocase subunit YajC
MSDALAADTVPAATTTTASTAQPPVDAPYELSAEKMMTDNVLILALLFFIFYFLLIRPQSRRVKIQQELMKSLQKGNKVLTSGGLIGTIIKFEGDDVVLIEVAQSVRVRVSRASVSEVLSDKAVAGENANDN